MCNVLDPAGGAKDAVQSSSHGQFGNAFYAAPEVLLENSAALTK
jgi:hypothetical protein